MSEASRAAALQHAAAVHHGSGDPVATLEAAEAFHSFIVGNGNGAEAPAPKTVAKAAAKTPAAKPAVKTPAKPAPAEEAEPDADAVTKEQVGEAIEAMLNANLRPAAIALFAKYKAKSLSGVDPASYAAILQDATDALMSA